MLIPPIESKESSLLAMFCVICCALDHDDKLTMMQAYGMHMECAIVRKNAVRMNRECGWTSNTE